MNNFICLNCKYRFKAKEQSKTCPYCNKDSIELEKSAEDIVSEIESLSD